MAQTATAPRQQPGDQQGQPPPQGGAPPSGQQGGGGNRRPTKTVEVDQVVGTFNDPEKLNAVLQNAHRHYHLISPATVCQELPEGFSVVAMLVKIDLLGDLAPADIDAKNAAKAKVMPPESRPGQWQINKSGLNRLANAAGVTTSPPVRMDDRRNPRKAEYETTAHWQTFDMQPIERTAMRCVDLSDGSDEASGMSENQLRQARLSVSTNAQTKSELRAIRAILSLKTGYTMDELQKPFLVVRLIADPRRIEDPETRKQVLLDRMRLAMGGHRALYGDAPRTVQVHAARPAPALPAGNHQTVTDVIDAQVEEREPVPAARPAAQPQRQQAQRPLKMPGGNDKGKPLTEASTSSLEWWVDRLASNIEAGSARDGDQRLLEGMQAELLKRGGPADVDDDERGQDFDDSAEDIPEDIFNSAPRGPRY